MKTITATVLTATVVAATMVSSVGETMAAAAAPAAAPAAPAATPPQPVITHGPPITGLCVLSAQLVHGGSLYGKAIDKQLEVIEVEINKELVGIQDGIKAEATKAELEKTTVSDLIYQTKVLNIQDKYNKFQQLAQDRQKEMDATEQQQNEAFAAELQKIAIAVYQERKCSTLIDREMVMIVSPEMEVSDAVIKAMDKDKSTIAPFPRVRFPATAVATGATKAN